MLSGPLEIKQLFRELDKTVSELIKSISSLDEEEINTVPYEGSWTAGLLCRHISKSTNAIAKAMRVETKTTHRDAGERIPEFRKTFLDFATKLKSPDFIVPEEGTYEKQATIEKLNDSFKRLRESSKDANLSGTVSGLPLGEITKLEMLHFVLYHTQRHLHQMKKIFESLKSNSYQ